MPKSRRSRGGPRHRRDPVARPVKPPSDPRLSALREAKVLPAVKQLSSADTRARSAAAAAVATLAQDPECRQLLLREHIVHTLLTQTLTDAALESRAAGWGILQLLAQEEGHDFCVHLFRQDILTSMDHAARATVQKLQSDFDSLPKAEKPFVISVASSLVSLATALAEASDDALVSVAANGSIAQLLALAIGQASDQSNPIADLRTDALACLMVLSEDNLQFSSELAQSPCFSTVMTLKAEADTDGILACAVLHNVFASLQESKNPADFLEADDSLLIPTLTKVISHIPLPPDDATVLGSGWSDPFEQQRLALEVLASIGTTLNSSSMDASKPPKASERMTDQDMGDVDEPVSDAEEHGQKDENDEEMGDDDIMNDLDMVAGADGDGDDGGGADDLPVLRALIQTAMPQLIRVARLESHGDNEADMRRLALSALNNIAWSTSVIDFADGHNVPIRKAWAPAARSLWEQLVSPVLATDTADVAVATQVTGLAWALARGLSGQAPLADGEPGKFMVLYRATKGLASSDPDSSDAFQSLGVKCVGVLGQLGREPAPVERNREIGVFLITLVAALPDTPSADAVEALDQLFEMYGDEAHACDGLVFWKNGFLSHLEAALPKVRAMAKTIDRKKEPELRARADDAAMNLGRFLAYKKKHAPSS
ncbi:hypothetical protein XA68_13726 [Ophiocordyceps unilateralis]|uniref:SYO1-like TPR repeats domain-containing protein n=1 Tax=Ophiocordyceps unilateralis TaxID=268505 RepID=A0A2A9PA41_OPHUN|nr:hypothetical protein XA68_13726 [Ophiocordyceps unilateralis]